VFLIRFVRVCIQSRKYQYEEKIKEAVIGINKPAEFGPDFESVEKVAKKLARKSYQRKTTEK
jgi:hypothetical protein